MYYTYNIPTQIQLSDSMKKKHSTKKCFDFAVLLRPFYKIEQMCVNRVNCLGEHLCICPENTQSRVAKSHDLIMTFRPLVKFFMRTRFLK